MRRASLLLGTGCVVVLMLACYHAVLFRGHQFAYRDAGHFYYPLYRVVQQEWEAGRAPLWNPWQNGGTPLLGTPMAAVLYPGKLLYAVLPYPQAARSYVLAHTIVALLGMLAMGRALGLSSTGSMISALSYAFGAPVLSLYSNVIFLVGAAWAPWGFRAILRLATPGHRWAVVELAVVLALQVLGGDPESAYWTAASGALYAGVVAFARERTPGEARRASDSVRPDRPGDGRGLVRAGPWGGSRRDEGMGPGLGVQRPVAVDRVGAGPDHLRRPEIASGGGPRRGSPGDGGAGGRGAAGDVADGRAARPGLGIRPSVERGWTAPSPRRCTITAWSRTGWRRPSGRTSSASRCPGTTPGSRPCRRRASG